jgi:hypothetical protein
MSTLAEIEKAIAVLPASEVEELSAWLSRRTQNPRGQTPGQPGRPLRDFFGSCASGDRRAADNDCIDMDLTCSV